MIRKTPVRVGRAFNYYDAYEKQARYAEEMVMNLSSAIKGGELGSRELTKALHVIEGDADESNHTIQAHLLSDFVVPMERGGMVALAHSLDDVCDSIEQIAIDAYTRKFIIEEGNVPSDISGLIDYMKNGVVSLCAAVTLLRSFERKSKEIKRHCVEAQDYEALADDLYIESVRALYENDLMSEQARRVYHDLLDTMEDAMDSVEQAAEMLESIVAESV